MEDYAPGDPAAVCPPGCRIRVIAPRVRPWMEDADLMADSRPIGPLQACYHDAVHLEPHIAANNFEVGAEFEVVNSFNHRVGDISSVAATVVYDSPPHKRVNLNVLSISKFRFDYCCEVAVSPAGAPVAPIPLPLRCGPFKNPELHHAWVACVESHEAKLREEKAKLREEAKSGAVKEGDGQRLPKIGQLQAWRATLSIPEPKGDHDAEDLRTWYLPNDRLRDLDSYDVAKANRPNMWRFRPGTIVPVNDRRDMWGMVVGTADMLHTQWNINVLPSWKLVTVQAGSLSDNVSRLKPRTLAEWLEGQKIEAKSATPGPGLVVCDDFGGFSAKIKIKDPKPEEPGDDCSAMLRDFDNGLLLDHEEFNLICRELRDTGRLEQARDLEDKYLAQRDRAEAQLLSCQFCGFQQNAQRASCAQCNADIVSGKEHREDAGEGVVTSTEIRMWNAARLSAGKTVLRCVQKRSRESQQWTRIRQMWNRTVVKGTPEDRANPGKKTWFNNIEHRFRTSEMLEDRQRSIGWTLATARAMGRLVPYAFQYAQRMRDEGHSSVPKWQREEQARCARIQTTRQTAKGGAGSITADPAIARRGQTLDARFPHAMATYRRATGTEPTEEPREEAQCSTWTLSSSSWTDQQWSWDEGRSRPWKQQRASSSSSDWWSRSEDWKWQGHGRGGGGGAGGGWHGDRRSQSWR